MGTLALDDRFASRGWFVVFTAESAKVVFTTERPRDSGFNLKNFATQGALWSLNGKLTTVIRGGNTIVFLRKDGLLYCLCASNEPDEREVASEKLESLLSELVRLCELLLGPNHRKIATQMDGFAQGLAKRTFWKTKPIIDAYIQDELGDEAARDRGGIAARQRWTTAEPEEETKCRRGRFKTKVPLGSYLVLRLPDSQNDNPVMVYESKLWKALIPRDQKIFKNVLEGLARKFVVENQQQSLVVYMDEEGDGSCLSLTSVPEEYGTPGLVLITVSPLNKVLALPPRILNRVAKYSRPAPLSWVQKIFVPQATKTAE